MAFACLLATTVLRTSEPALSFGAELSLIGQVPAPCSRIWRYWRAKKTARYTAPISLKLRKCALARLRQIGPLVFFRRNAMCARLRSLARRAFGRRRVGTIAAHRGEMREEAARA